MLNRYWGMDAPVPRADPKLLVVVPLNKASEKSRPLAPDERIDAAGQGLRQDDVFLRILSVQLGTVDEQGAKTFLLIQFRLANTGSDRPISFEGFGRDKHKPVLKDAAGITYAFVAQRKRKIPAGGIVFLAAAPETVDVMPSRILDYQLVFEPPGENFSPLNLDLPAAAWGRTGVGKLRISGLFEPILPPVKKD